MQGFPRSCQGNRRNQPQLETGSKEAMGQCPVIVAGRFEADDNRLGDLRQIVSKPVVVLLRCHDRHAATSSALGSFNQNLLAVL